MSMPSGDAPLMVSVSGCRGIVGASMTPEVAARFAGAFGGWLVERRTSTSGANAPSAPIRVVLGRDGRAGGQMLRDAAAAGLMGAGCHVIDLGIAMTPTVGVMVDHHGADGGMVLTASHNPQPWNGLKCLVREPGMAPGIVSACAPAAGDAARIADRFRAGRIGLVGWSAIGTTTAEVRAAGAHLGLVLRALGDDAASAIAKRRFTVVLDSVNASGVSAGRELLEQLGCRVVHLGADASGVFPHAPEPTRENLTELCEAVRREKADVGFAQDPDADRLAIVDERGGYIGEEYTLALAAEAVLGAVENGRAGEVLATNLSTSRMVEDVAARYGARVVRSAVGEANVVEAMKRDRTVLGGEGNGGVIWPRVTYVRDSLSGMALVLGLMARSGQSVSALVAGVPRYAIEKRKVDLQRKEDAAPAVEAVAAAYARERVDLQDGVRVDFDSRAAWLHVRASNTEPIMRLIAEAPSADEARRVLDEAARVIG